ncbi:hypothetical protein BH10BDE1_BH10BDE1_26110 [soil metagenome]
MRKCRGASSANTYKTLIAIGFVLISTFAQPASADDPKHLFGFVDWVNGITNKLCKRVEPGSPVKAPVAEAPQATKATKPNGPQTRPSETFKSRDELRRYLECYSTEKGRYDKIQKDYLPIIESAAKEFEVPQTLLACLIFRESRFDINARSSTGAMGLGQHLKGTMQYLTQLLKPMDASTLKRSTDDIVLSEQELAAKNGNSLGQAKKDRALAKTRLTNRLHTIGWESYFANLDKRKMHSGPVPRVISPATIKDPRIAIGATAMYLKMILYDFRESLDLDLRVSNHDKQQPNYHLLLAAAGAYNMGPGAAIKILGPIEPPDREKWVAALAHSNEETAKHILSIQRCIESSSSKRENAFRGPIGSATYDCNDGNESTEPRTVTQAFNDLPDEYKSHYKTASMKDKKSKAKKTSKAAKSDQASKKKKKGEK